MNNETRSHVSRLWVTAIPYVTVLIGYYWLDNVWIAFGAYHLLILVVLAAYGELGQLKRIKKGFNWKATILSTLPCLSAGALILWLWPIAALDGLDLTTELETIGLGGALWYVMCHYAFFVNPWLEEALWRGFLGAKTKVPTFVDFAFAGYHVLVLVQFVKWPWVIVGAILLVAGSWLWRRLSHRFGGLAVPALTHLAADIGILGAIHKLQM